MTSGPEDPLARARRLAAAGDLAGAITQLEQLFEFAEASRLAERAGELGRALRSSLEARDHGRVVALRQRIVTDGSAADLATAAAAYERARNFSEAAECLELAGELERAADLWARALEPARAGRLLESLGRYRDAGVLFEEHLGQHPDDAEIALHLGRILSRFGLHDRAIPWLQRARDSAEHAEDALAELVGSFAAAGMAGAAEAAYRTLREANPEVPPEAAEFLRVRSARDLERTRSDDDRWLVGRYRLLGVLGAGGMARVHRAIDDFTGDEVAVKIFAGLSRAEGRGSDAFDRFLREARIVKALGHPNVVAVREFNSQLGFIVMELMAGTLEDRLARVTALPGRQCPGVLLPLCAALEAAHQRGIIHRDIKPANVFFGAAGEVKLGDFGVAHLQEIGATQTGGLTGTLAYMAPEQISGTALTFAADLYSLGVTTFRMLTGHLPFESGDLATMHLSVAPPRLRDRGVEAPATAEALVARLLAKDPAARHPSVSALRAEIGVVDWRFAAVSAGPRQIAELSSGAADGGESAASGGAPAIVAGRYEEVDAPRRAGPSEIVRAHDRRLGRPVVLERLDARPVVEKLLGARRAVASRGGAGLQTVLAIDVEDPERPQIVLEEAAEGTFEDRLRRSDAGPLPVPVAFELGAAVARALAPLHAVGQGLGGIVPARVLGAPPWILEVAGAPSAGATPAEDLAAVWSLVASALAGHELPDVRGPDAFLRRFAAAFRVALPPMALTTLSSFAASEAARETPRPEPALVLARLLGSLGEAARDRAGRLERLVELEALAGAEAGAAAFVGSRREAWEIPAEVATVAGDEPA